MPLPSQSDLYDVKALTQESHRHKSPAMHSKFMPFASVVLN